MERCVDGAVIAYGAAGTGKTHTMIGSQSEDGLVQLVVQDLLGYWPKCTVSLAMFEIHNERVTDLLNKGEELTVLEQNGNTVLRGLQDLQLGSTSQANQLLATGLRQRGSSRSRHTLIRLSVAHEFGVSKLHMVIHHTRTGVTS